MKNKKTATQATTETKTKKKGERKMTGWIIVLAIVIVLGAGGIIGWSYIAKEHSEAGTSARHGGLLQAEDGLYRRKTAHVQMARQLAR